MLIKYIIFLIDNALDFAKMRSKSAVDFKNLG